MSRKRSLRELLHGESVNVHSTPTRAAWEKHALPIYIPIQKGILGYRLLLINQEDLGKFKAIRDVGDLKKLRAGLDMQ